MIEELKQILLIVKDLPHMVMWVLAGILFYKVVMIGSIFGIIKLAINKTFEYATREKPKEVQVHEWKLAGMTVDNETRYELERFLLSLRTGSLNYLHKHHVLELIVAWDQYKKNKSPTTMTQVFASSNVNPNTEVNS